MASKENNVLDPSTTFLWATVLAFYALPLRLPCCFFIIQILFSICILRSSLFFGASPTRRSTAASMASGSEAENASFLERLIGSRNRDLSLFFPIILGVMGPPPRDSQESSNGGQDRDHGAERIVLINPFTQGMIIIDGGGANFDALVRGLSEMESGKSGPPPASKASIEALAAVQVWDEGEECAICLEGMEEAKEMPCKHRYHGECIGKWLELHGSCPVCRYRMPVEDEEVKGGGEGEGEGERGGGRREGSTEREGWASFSLGRRDSTSSPEAEPPTPTPDTPANQEED